MKSIILRERIKKNHLSGFFIFIVLKRDNLIGREMVLKFFIIIFVIKSLSYLYLHSKFWMDKKFRNILSLQTLKLLLPLRTCIPLGFQWPQRN